MNTSPTLTRTQSLEKMNAPGICNKNYEFSRISDQDQDNHDCCKCVKEYLIHAQDSKDNIIKRGNNFHFCGLGENKQCTGKTKIETWVRSVKNRRTSTPRKVQKGYKVNLDFWKPAGLEIRLEDVCFSGVTITKYIEPKLKYERGTLVWVKMQGYPTWPGMVDDDPDNNTFYWVVEQKPQKIHYHVVFFDEKPYASRAWRPEESLKLFTFNPRVSFKSMSLFKRFQAGFNEAKKALNMSLKERIEKYGFVNKIKQPDVILVED